MASIFNRNREPVEDVEPERLNAALERVARITAAAQKTITVSPEAATVEYITKLAAKERRTVANMATVLVERAVDVLRGGGKLENGPQIGLFNYPAPDALDASDFVLPE